MWRVFLLGCVLSAMPSLSQTLDQFAGSSVFLYRTNPNPVLKNGKPVIQNGKKVFETKYGTGFLVTVDDNNLFLVTAEHVAKDIKSDFHVIVRGDNDTPIDMPSEELTGTKNVTWIAHGVEDVAVLRLHPGKDIFAKLTGHFMQTLLISSDSKSPGRERTLVVLGFPLTLGAAGHFSPISRESKPSSGLITLPRFDTKKLAIFFLLSDPSIAGFSGAPVLLTAAPYTLPSGAMVFPETGGPTRPSTHCVGIVHGTISDETGGKMAAITPSMYILETIDKAMGK